MRDFIRDAIINLPRLPSRQERLDNKPQSPWTICKKLSLMQYCYFFVGFCAWIIDAFDFFSVSVTLTRLSKQFDNRSISTLSTSVTLTLLLRSVGALIFGIITDRFGRRWPLTVNLVFIGGFALGTGFVQTYPQFLALRCLFGVFMGGIYGMSTATALENLPAEARGLFSGILQQGYAIGNLIAASVNLSLVNRTNDWRTIFYLGGSLSLFIACLRAACPESSVFLKAQAEVRRQPDLLGRSPTTIYCQCLKTAMKIHWSRFLFTVFLLAGFNFLAHGSQDLYPTYVQVTKGMSSHDASILTIIGNCGAVMGGILAGWLSQFLGRRLSIIIMVLWSAAFIPLWMLPTSFTGLAFGAALLQFGVQGAWGVVPIYISELSPPAFRGIFAGLSYQLGNMLSAPSQQIEAHAGEAHRTLLRGREVVDYAYVQGMFLGIVSAYLIILTCFGQEYRGRSFDQAGIQASSGKVAQLKNERPFSDSQFSETNIVCKASKMKSDYVGP